MSSSRITGVVRDQRVYSHSPGITSRRVAAEVIETVINAATRTLGTNGAASTRSSSAPQAVTLRSPMGPPDDTLGVRQVEIVSDVGGNKGEDLVQQGSTLHEECGDFSEGPEHRSRRERREGVPPSNRQGRPPHASYGASLAHYGVSLAHAPAHSRPARGT